MTDLTVPSGVPVVINPASWEDAIALKKALFREMAMGRGMNLPTFLMVASSDAVEVALYKCLARCLYDGQKITKKTFDPIETRQDYPAIAAACGRENLSPLWPGLLSLLEELSQIVTKQANIENDQKSA